ncbi:MAG: class I SAM-dependent methyltransferase [Bacteroidia bacterium]|nr:class I SAM-dependent methyltransferase [Bacteroidia bacterium]NNJ55075.1 class I SAM-dependent methyltransferase [Bacteroidia bacterium]
MENHLIINTCPVCKGEKFKPSIAVPDWLVSNETFNIVACESCDFRFIENAPLPENAGKYYETEEYVEHSDTKKGLVNIIYHFARKRMMKYKQRLISDVTIGKKLLDIGSGSGYFLNYMKNQNYNVTGVEISDKAVKLCKEKYDITAFSPTQLINGEISESFDVVTMWHVFEHVYSYDEYFERLHSGLSDNGTLIIAMPNHQCFEASYYGKYWNGYDTPRHLWHFVPDTFRRFVEARGFKLVKMKKLPLDPFYNSMISASYKKRFTFLPFTFFIGLISWFMALFSFQKSSSIVYFLQKK